VGPAYFGQGVEPWPAEATHTDAAITTAAVATQRAPHLVVGNNAYIAIGTFLYRSVALNAAGWGNFTQVSNAGVTIHGLAYYQGDVLMLCGTGSDILRFNTVAGTTAVWSAGQKAKVGIGYNRRLIFADPTAGNEELLKMSTGAGIDTRELDSPIVTMGLFGGKVAIATRTAIWLLGGKSDNVAGKWLGDPEPFFSNGIYADDEDFIFLLALGGRLFTWLGNELQEWNPSNQRQGWVSRGLEGASCYGATVAGGKLIVSIVTRRGDSETWAYDGSGWWLIHRAPAGAGATRIWPMYAGGAGNQDLVLFRDNAAGVVYDLYRLVWRSDTLHTYRSSAAFQTSLLDCGERDKLKAWRKVGALFAVPEVRGNAASGDGVTLTLSYSVDGGKTFTTAATTSVDDPTMRTIELDFALANNAAASRWLQLKVAWSSVLDWAPVLTGLWAEYELLDQPARRRRWAFKVHTRDVTVQRDGAVAARSGRQLAADLWTDWQAGATVPFKDLDFDTTGVTYQVRVVGIGEEVAKPADGGRWGESTLALTLVEV
jgi:hypothetical protein